MKTSRLYFYIVIVVIAIILNSNVSFAQISFSQPVPFNQVTIDDNFWAPLQKTHSTVTLATCIVQLRDSTKRMCNFEKAAGLKEGKHEGKFYDDSDVYKVMEGMACSMMNNPNPGIDNLLDKWIYLISESQQHDGYLNTFYTLNFPDKRWTDMDKHEMYCGGHMVEAAIAHYKATGKKTFLDVAIRFADHLDINFGPGKRHWVPGHEEIELALIKLFYTTRDRRYLELAYWLLEERGHGYGSIGKEREYYQDNVPVREITDIQGHAVRAMYLFTGMADIVASGKNAPGYIDALKRVWDDVVLRNMYITGGIGSSKQNEGFTVDYDLPNKTAYCETCSSIGMAFWNNRMNLLSNDAKYVDVMERSMYNGVLSGVSLSGDLFFYRNPLESDGNYHRTRWFNTSCCPSNICRFIPSIGNYIYMHNEDEIFINLYVGSKADFNIGSKKIKISQETNYPWDGTIFLSIEPELVTNLTVNLRIPGWCKNYKLEINGKRILKTNIQNGYLHFERIWNKGDLVKLILDMPVEKVADNPNVKENIGKITIQRGPLVYCVEECDNKDILWEHLQLSPKNKFSMEDASGKLHGMKLIKTRINGNTLSFIPYFAWDNREAGKMKVWTDLKN